MSANPLEPVSSDDCNVILQDWDESDPDQLIAIRLASELIKAREALEYIFGLTGYANCDNCNDVHIAARAAIARATEQGHE